MAMRARGAVTEMAVVAAHAAVRLHMKNGVEEMLENTFPMGPGELRASTTGASKASGTRKNKLHGDSPTSAGG